MKRAAAIAAVAVITVSCAPSPPVRPMPRAAAASFLCERGQIVELRFMGENAELTTGGVSVVLKQQPAASGIDYAGGGYRLRGKGPQLVLTDRTGKTQDCTDRAWAMQQPQIQEPVFNLAGTAWRLVHFQSSDDAIGTIIPPNPERYVLRFGTDGTVAMQLDCNRANARYEARPGSSRSGSISMTPGMMTRAFCGPKAMDSRIAADSVRMRSYTMSGERLSLALEADAGIYLWDPLPTTK